MVIYSGYAKYYTGCRREIQCLCRFIYILWKNDVMHCLKMVTLSPQSDTISDER